MLNNYRSIPIDHKSQRNKHNGAWCND